MEGGATTGTNPRTVEEVFEDFRGRRAGMLKALTAGKYAAWKASSLLSIGALQIQGNYSFRHPVCNMRFLSMCPSLVLIAL